MLKLLPLALIPVLLLSCSTYQYMTVSSADMRQSKQQEFVIENDSFRLTYKFSGMNAPIHLTLVNKLAQPVYVDWKRSALIVNKQAISYVPSSVSISGSYSGSMVQPVTSFNNTLASSSGRFSGQMGVPSYMDFIPPGSELVKTPMGVTNRFFDEIPRSTYEPVTMWVPGANTHAKMLRATFTTNDSPLQFSSYLTLYASDSLAKPVIYNHSFYVSEVIKTDMGPRQFQNINGNPGNRFYLTKTSAVGQVAGYGVLAGVALLTWKAAQTANQSQ